MATLPNEDLQNDKKLQEVTVVFGNFSGWIRKLFPVKILNPTLFSCKMLVFFRVLGRVTLITWMQENLKVFQVVMLQPCFEKDWLVWLALKGMRESTFTLVYWG